MSVHEFTERDAKCVIKEGGACPGSTVNNTMHVCALTTQKKEKDRVFLSDHKCMKWSINY